MLFQTWQYLVLLLISITVVSLIRKPVINKIIILVLSIFFYSYGAKWQVILFLSVIIATYIFALLLEKNRSKVRAVIFVLVLFLPLLLYKYVPFILSQIYSAGADVYSEIFLLPIGISFYTFQAVGYIIDVYRGTKAERSVLNLACFISFFPQLVAGPIERYDNIMGQIDSLKRPRYETMVSGFRYIILGLCLKLLVAETMASFVNPVFNDLSNKGGLAVLIATFCFGIQIYCDFNGYTQIAIGSAKLLGVDLMQNFNHPYRAKTITDFWRRWHISLTTWFKDYLYIPLGGNRKGKVRTALNTVITFFVSGIWHGANWTFALWGLANGIGMAIEKLFVKKVSKNKISTVCYAILAFFITNLFWVLFRANSIQDAFLCYELMLFDTIPQICSMNSIGAVVSFLVRDNGWSSADFLPMLISAIIYIWYEYGFKNKADLEKCLFSHKSYIRWITYIIIVFATLYFGRTLVQNSFVYFRF